MCRPVRSLRPNCSIAADETTRAAWAGLPDASAFKIVAVPPAEAHGLFLSRLNGLLWPTAYREGAA